MVYPENVFILDEDTFITDEKTSLFDFNIFNVWNISNSCWTSLLCLTFVFFIYFVRGRVLWIEIYLTDSEINVRDTEGAIKNIQTREIGNIMYIWRNQIKQNIRQTPLQANKDKPHKQDISLHTNNWWSRRTNHRLYWSIDYMWNI